MSKIQLIGILITGLATSISFADSGDVLVDSNPSRGFYNTSMLYSVPNPQNLLLPGMTGGYSQDLGRAGLHRMGGQLFIDRAVNVTSIFTSTITVSTVTVSNYEAVGSTVAAFVTTTPPVSLLVNGTLMAVQTTDTSTGLRGVSAAQISNDAASAHHAGFKARGTPSSLSAVQASDYISSLIPNPYDGTNFLIPGQVVFQVSPGSTISNGIVDTDLVILTSSGIADGLERMRVSWDGYVGINQGVNTINRFGTLSVSAIPGSNALRLNSSDNSFGVLDVTSNGTSAAVNITAASNAMSISGAGAPPNGQALCLSSGKLGHCTSAVSSAGACTCSAP